MVAGRIGSVYGKPFREVLGVLAFWTYLPTSDLRVVISHVAAPGYTIKCRVIPMRNGIPLQVDPVSISALCRAYER